MGIAGALAVTETASAASVTATFGSFSAGLNLPRYSTDPTPQDGDVWINTVTSGIRWQVGGTKYEIIGTAV